MFKGTVSFRGRIKGNGLKVPLRSFNPNEPGVDKVEVEGPNGEPCRPMSFVRIGVRASRSRRSVENSYILRRRSGKSRPTSLRRKKF